MYTERKKDVADFSKPFVKVQWFTAHAVLNVPTLVVKHWIPKTISENLEKNLDNIKTQIVCCVAKMNVINVCANHFI